LGATATAIGWDVVEVNGHDIEEVSTSLANVGGTNPKMIICHTIKGKGVPFMEDVPAWHAQWVDDEKELEIREMLK
jgi:transketolase